MRSLACRGRARDPETDWSYRFHPEDGFIEGPSATELLQQVTPIVVDGVMYLPAGNRVVALRPETGEEVGEVYMPAGVSGSPMTCMHDGAQYIVTAVSGGGHVGELLAYRLVD